MAIDLEPRILFLNSIFDQKFPTARIPARCRTRYFWSIVVLVHHISQSSGSLGIRIAAVEGVDARQDLGDISNLVFY